MAAANGLVLPGVYSKRRAVRERRKSDSAPLRRGCPIRRELILKLLFLVVLAMFVTINVLLWRSPAMNPPLAPFMPLLAYPTVGMSGRLPADRHHRRAADAGNAAPAPSQDQDKHQQRHLVGVQGESDAPPQVPMQLQAAVEAQKKTEKESLGADASVGQCGLSSACKPDHLAFRISTGRKDRLPEICFRGETVKLEAAHRGSVFVVSAVAPRWKVRLRVFDVAGVAGETASQELADFVQSQPEGAALLVAASPGSTRSLSPAARSVLHQTGSGHVHLLSARTSWAMATTKGLAVSTPHEAVAGVVGAGTVSPEEEGATLSACMPVDLYLAETGIQKRKQFCRTYQRRRGAGGSEAKRYDAFCAPLAVSQYLLPAAPKDRVGGAMATQVPITVLSRHDRPDYLQQCLSSLFLNAGLLPEYLTVYVDSYSQEVHDLVSMFALRARFFPKTVSTSTMKDVHKRADEITSHYARVLPLAWASYPSARYMILLEEDHTVSPDFLFFFSQLIPTLDADHSLMAASAYNDNGYSYAAQDNGLVYRSEFFPGRGWMLPQRVWKEWEASFPKCCGGWSWDLWIRDPAQRGSRETLIPDVPRVHHIGKHGKQVNGYYWELYFSPAILNTDANAVIRSREVLVKDQYEKYLKDLIKTALKLPVKDKACGADMVPMESFGLRYLLYYHQDSPKDTKQLEKILKCFRLWDLGPRGLHNGLFRFHCKYNHILLIGSKSSYAKTMMPANTVPYRVS